jgi:hypothetical protein
VLALSGWTANDFTSGTNLDSVFVGHDASPAQIEKTRAYLERERSAALPAIEHTLGSGQATLAALNALAKRGQVIYDYASERYRFRSILPFELSEAQLGPEPPEISGGRKLADQVHLTRDEALPGGQRAYVADVGGTKCEAVIDADGKLTRARCNCSFFYRNRLRAGPCRHLLALRLATTSVSSGAAANLLSRLLGTSHFSRKPS